MLSGLIMTERISCHPQKHKYDNLLWPIIIIIIIFMQHDVEMVQWESLNTGRKSSSRVLTVHILTWHNNKLAAHSILNSVFGCILVSLNLT